MKGQSFVIQFVLFFIIGFSLYLTIGNFFKYQSDIFRGQIAQESIKTVNSYLTSNLILAADTCKQCDYVNLTFKVGNTTAGYYLNFDFSQSNVNVSVTSTNYSFITSGHNLNSIYALSGQTLSSKTITLTLNRTKNGIGISG